MVEISDAVRDPQTRWVIAMMASQMAKTEGCLNEIGRKLDDDPEPILYIGPTQKNVQEKIEPRILNMIDSASNLSGKMLRGKRSTKTCKRIAGVTLNLGWAGSATEVSSQPAAMVLIDELDRMRDIKGEGSVIELSAARGDTYPNFKGIVDSTPTEGNVDTFVHPETGIQHWKWTDPEDVFSPVWQYWQEGSREEWAVPCPHCKDFFVPRFELLWWPKKCSAEDAAQKACLTCFRCGSQIEDRWRTWMNERGTFLGPGQYIKDGVKHGDLINTSTRSFWASGLMSPFVPFGRRAQDWLRAAKAKDQGRIQTVINTRFGQLYRMSGDAPEWQVVNSCRGEYEPGCVPEGVQRLFATVDVQKNRLVYALRGWGYNWESWGIDHGEIYGDTKNPEDACWEQLQTFLDKDVDGFAINAMAIDSGYNTPAVDAFAKKNKSRVYATVGRDNPTKLFKPTPQEINRRGKTVKTGLDRWTLDHGYFKGWLHERLAWPQDQTGSWHIPVKTEDKFEDDYCRQLVAEHRVKLPSGRTKWLRVHQDNHYLDCEYLQVFLAFLFRVGDLSPGSGQPKKQPAKKKAAPRGGGGWVDPKPGWMNR